MALTNHFHRPRPVPLIMSVSAVVILFALGIWQLQRLTWKEAVIAEIEQAAENTPLQGLPDHPEDYRFYRAQLTGSYMPELEFHLAARYFRSELGYSIFNPFRLSDGRIVLVNRGWVPARTKESAPPAPKDPQTLLAQIRTSHERNPFTPANQPQQNVWFGRDALEMGRHAGLDVLPITLDVIGDQDPAQLPVPSNGDIRPRNDHLGYAITWFGVGLAALAISLLYHRKKPDGNKASSQVRPEDDEGSD